MVEEEQKKERFLRQSYNYFQKGHARQDGGEPGSYACWPSFFLILPLTRHNKERNRPNQVSLD